MLRHHLFNLLIAVALVIVTALTAREAVATTVIRLPEATFSRCHSLPSRHSIRTEYVKETSMWVMRTENGSAGADGGLIDLLSSYRACSR